MALQIKPGLRRVWRGPGTVQIGLDPRWGTVLDGLTAADATLVEALAEGHAIEIPARAPAAMPATGPTTVPTTGSMTRPATGPTNGPAIAREAELSALLIEAGVALTRRTDRVWLGELGRDLDRLAPDAAAWSLLPQDDGSPSHDDGWQRLAARGRRTVRIVGAGRIGTALATTLAAAGVGRLDVLDPAPVNAADVTPAGAGPADIGIARAQAARRAIRRVVGEDRAPVRGAVPDLVVLIEPDAADAVAAQQLVARDVHHLSIVIREGSVIVGPLVRPGASACLRCLDLHRSDRDPAWPRVLAQLLAARAGGGGGHHTHAEETASAQLAASLACLQVLADLDTRHSGDRSGTPSVAPARAPASLSATLEIDLPDGLISRREWPLHHTCGCHALPTAGGPATMAR